MRVLITTDCVGGVWNHSLGLAARLIDDYDMEVFIVVFGGLVSSEKARELDRMGAQWFDSPCKLEWMEEPWDDLAASAELLREIIADFNPDLIHLNSYALAAELEGERPLVVGAHSCVASWWQAVKRESIPPRYREYVERVSAGLNAADEVVAPSHAMAEALSACYDVSGPIQVISNGVDTDEYFPLHKEFHFLAVGRAWDEAKNIRLLEQIGSELDWPVLHAGPVDSPDGKGCPFKNVCSLGELSPAALRVEYARATAFLAPALYEPFGLSILEAAHTHCVLVLADIPSLREIWRDSAIFIDPLRPELWLKALNWLSQDEESRRLFAHRAALRAREYTADRMARAYHSLYRSLVLPTHTLFPIALS